MKAFTSSSCGRRRLSTLRRFSSSWIECTVSTGWVIKSWWLTMTVGTSAIAWKRQQVYFSHRARPASIGNPLREFNERATSRGLRTTTIALGISSKGFQKGKRRHSRGSLSTQGLLASRLMIISFACDSNSFNSSVANPLSKWGENSDTISHCAPSDRRMRSLRRRASRRSQNPFWLSCWGPRALPSGPI